MTLSAATADRVVCASGNPQGADSPPAQEYFFQKKTKLLSTQPSFYNLLPNPDVISVGRIPLTILLVCQPQTGTWPLYGHQRPRPTQRHIGSTQISATKADIGGAGITGLIKIE